MVQSDQILSAYTTISSSYSLVAGTVGSGVTFSDTIGPVTVKLFFLK